jgi:SAM-dependent methyltransferase
MTQYQKDLKEGMRILELGGVGHFRIPGFHTVGSVGDLRYWTSGVHEGYDLALCMEVLEHINDQETRKLKTEWRGDGVAHLLKATFDALRPGGILFLTTPNAHSITTIHHALHMRPGYLYRPHVREYAVYELDELVRNAGFEIERRETLDVWLNALSPVNHKLIKDFISNNGFPTCLRGEDIFLLASKP